MKTKTLIMRLAIVVSSLSSSPPLLAQQCAPSAEVDAVDFALDTVPGSPRIRALQIWTEREAVSSVQFRIRLYKDGEIESIGPLTNVAVQNSGARGVSALLASTIMLKPAFVGDGPYVERIEVIAKNAETGAHHTVSRTLFYSVERGVAYPLTRDEYDDLTTHFDYEPGRDGKPEKRIQAAIEKVSNPTARHVAERVE